MTTSCNTSAAGQIPFPSRCSIGLLGVDEGVDEVVGALELEFVVELDACAVVATEGLTVG